MIAKQKQKQKQKQQRHSLLSSFVRLLVGANVVALVALWQQDQQIRNLPSQRDQQQEQESIIIEPTSNRQPQPHHRRLQQKQQTTSQQQQQQQQELAAAYSLQGKKVLVAIAAYDFSQLPHLEEVLDSYHDVCIAGAVVHVVIHTTIAWPVALLDLLQTRFPCPHFQLELILKLPKIKLHLVDCHRQLFYERLDDYDVFIYSEDDIRVTPRTIATYLQETKRVEQLLLLQKDDDNNADTDADADATGDNNDNQKKYKPSDFNVGIVRYEYNFPSNVIMDDTTRHATENVTRVYWEHSSFEPPYIPNAMDHVPQTPLAAHYFHMKNHHQGMFLATRSLLKEWKIRPNCQFDVASNRPGRPKKPSQPLFGTQRVWMSSLQLYGNKHGCHVQQVLPIDAFGALTVHHVPNKNYRRVGQYRTRDMVRDEQVAVSHQDLLGALRLHLELTGTFRPVPRHQEDTIIGLAMHVSPEIKVSQYPDSWKGHLEDFDEYMEDGGVLSKAQRLQASL